MKPTWMLIRTRHYFAVIAVVLNQSLGSLARHFGWLNIAAVSTAISLPLVIWMLYAIWTDDPRCLTDPKPATRKDR